MSGQRHDFSEGLAAAASLARRDLLEFLRDRRTVFITLFLPMVTYPLVALSSALAVRSAVTTVEQQHQPTPISIVFSGPEAPALAGMLARLLSGQTPEQHAGWPSDVVAEIESPDRARDLLDSGRVDFWIDLPEGFVAGMERFGTVRVEARVGAKAPATRKARGQLEALFQSLARKLRQDRIAAAGLPQSLLEPLRLEFSGPTETQPVVADRAVVRPLAGAILVLLSVLTMTGGFYPAIDAIAGEKERGTIETLLIVPCSTNDIVAGKFLAVFGVTIATLVANLISILLTASVAVGFLPVGSAGYYLQNLGVGMAVTLPAFTGLAAVAAALSLAVTTASKSMKEAQNTLTPVIMLVTALAGVALLPGTDLDGVVPAVPFTGQVLVAQAAFTPPEDTGPVPAVATLLVLLRPLLFSLAGSAALTWLLLRGTSAMLADEDLLFRGPDVAGTAFRRPARRSVPLPIHGLLALGIGLAGLWYAQGLAAVDLILAIPVQQAAVIAPVVILMLWQRVNLRRTFALRWPGEGHGLIRVGTGLSTLIAATLLGVGIFIVGAAAFLDFHGPEVSDAMRSLSLRLLSLMLEQPWWLAWCLMAVLPAVCEELLFRGWVLSALAGMRPGWRRATVAVVGQAACFAVFHLLPERMPQTFALGLVLGCLTLATRSLLPAMCCHAANNSMPLAVLIGSGVATDADPAGIPLEGLESLSLPPLAVAAGVAAMAAGLGIIAMLHGLFSRQPPVRQT